MQLSNPLIVHVPDTRGVQISPYGLGNLKIGPTVYTYSRLPGLPSLPALGFDAYHDPHSWYRDTRGTCPGSTPECRTICYASRPVTEQGIVFGVWKENSQTEEVPPIPDRCTLLRLHVSGDFTSTAYIENWITRLLARPDVTCWAYTRSWRVPELLPALERLRALANVQLFASMDVSTEEMPPDGWRRAWIDGDPRAGTPHQIHAHSDVAATFKAFGLQQTEDSVKALICPEETKAVPDCERCGFCFYGARNDVVFLKH